MLEAMPSTRTPIGVDLDGRRVKAVQLRRLRSGWALQAAAAFDHPDPNAAADERTVHRLVDVLYRQGFVGTDLIVSVPADRQLSSLLELPPRDSGAPVEQLARMELARTHERSPESFEMACWDLPGTSRAARNTCLMAVACEHEDAEQMLDAFEHQGLTITALDVQSCALARACLVRTDTTDAVTAVLNVDWQTVRLVLVHGTVVVYERALTEGAIGPLHAALVEALHAEADVVTHLLQQVGLTDKQLGDATGQGQPVDLRRRLTGHLGSMIEELRHSMAYAAHRYPDHPIGRLVLTGMGAAVAGLPHHLADALQIDAAPMAPADVVDCPQALLGLCSEPDLMTALGLAMYRRDMT